MSERFFYNDTQSRSDVHSINATDLQAVIALPTGQILELATLSMMSLSTHRDGFPVTSLGYVGPKGFTRGHRLTAGTLVFSVFERSAFTKLMNPLEAPTGYVNAASREKKTEIKSAFYNMHADELPPFDIHIIYANSDGLLCYEALLGVVIVDQGSVRSMDLIQIQESYAYMATDHIPIQRLETLASSGSNTTKQPPVVRITPTKVLNQIKSQDIPNYTPEYQWVRRGESKIFPTSVHINNPNSNLNGPDSHYTQQTWRDRWEIRSQGSVVAHGFKRIPDPLGWLVERDNAGPGDGDANCADTLTLKITIPDSFMARLGNYVATYEDGFLGQFTNNTSRFATTSFSIAPHDYVTAGGQNT